MSLWRGAYWALVAVTLAIYAVMIFDTLPTITDAAGGLAPFDLRPGGYSLEPAHTFLAALDRDAVELYLGRQHALDRIYPACLAAVLGFGLFHILRPAAGWLRWTGVALAVSGGVSDYLENHFVAEMLRRWPEMPAEDLVALASGATLAKSMLTTAAMVMLAGALLWRWRRGSA